MRYFVIFAVLIVFLFGNSLFPASAIMPPPDFRGESDVIIEKGLIPGAPVQVWKKIWTGGLFKPDLVTTLTSSYVGNFEFEFNASFSSQQEDGDECPLVSHIVRKKLIAGNLVKISDAFTHLWSVKCNGIPWKEIGEQNINGARIGKALVDHFGFTDIRLIEIVEEMNSKERVLVNGFLGIRTPSQPGLP